MSGAFGVGVAGGSSGGSLMERNLDRWTILFAVLFVVNTIAIIKILSTTARPSEGLQGTSRRARRHLVPRSRRRGGVLRKLRCAPLGEPSAHRFGRMRAASTPRGRRRPCSPARQLGERRDLERRAQGRIAERPIRPGKRHASARDRVRQQRRVGRPVPDPARGRASARARGAARGRWSRSRSRPAARPARARRGRARAPRQPAASSRAASCAASVATGFARTVHGALDGVAERVERARGQLVARAATRPAPGRRPRPRGRTRGVASSTPRACRCPRVISAPDSVVGIAIAACRRRRAAPAPWPRRSRARRRARPAGHR